MDYYWSLSTEELGVPLVRGRYRILARFQGEGGDTWGHAGVALMNVWKGTVQSEAVEFVMPGNAALDLSAKRWLGLANIRPRAFSVPCKARYALAGTHHG